MTRRLPILTTTGLDAGRVPTDALVAQSQVSDCPRRLGRVLQTRDDQSRELASVVNGRIRATSAPERAGNCGDERSSHGHRERPGRAPREASSALLPQDPSSVYGAYPGEFTETGLGITAQYGSTGLSRVAGDDQVVCAARGTGSAGMDEQASMVVPAISSQAQPRSTQLITI